MIGRKQDLAVQVSQLEARLKEIEATESVHAIAEFDDTDLGRVEALISELNHDLDVREALLEAEGQLPGRIPVEKFDDSADDVLAEIDRHFRSADDDADAELAAAK